VGADYLRDAAPSGNAFVAVKNRSHKSTEIQGGEQLPVGLICATIQ